MLANKIVIINYRMGNVASVQKGFKKIGAETILSHEKNDIENADYLVLPGVGAFGDGMKNLKELGLIEILNKFFIRVTVMQSRSQIVATVGPSSGELSVIERMIVGGMDVAR